jgi:tetratricopeptide (TPR) repeat protein
VYQWLLEGQVHHKGHQHPDAAYTRFLMGNVYTVGARWREAVAQFKLALEAQSAVLGEQDCHTLRTQLALGKSYLFVGSLPEALGILERTLATQRYVLPDAHPDTLDTMINLAAAYGQEKGHSEASRDLLQEAVQVLENTVPLNRHLLIPALVNLGKTYEDSGLFEEAKGHYLRALELEQTDSGAAEARVQHIQNLLMQLCRKTNMDLPA